MQREGVDDKQVLVLDTEYARVRRAGGNGRETLARAFLDSVLGVVQREVAVSQRNFMQLTLNERLSTALNIATNSQLPSDPQRWWQWWDEENDIVRQGDKQTRQRQQTRLVSVQDRRPDFGSQSRFGGSQSTPTRRQAECFAAGTPVLTRHGPIAIEKIRIGDLVLAQQVDTGELAFKPVLRTTVRAAEQLVKIEVGRDIFETSQGHLFWAPGDGWTKARQLVAGVQLQSLKGPQSISAVAEGSKAETYNLLVADFHTYFVGVDRILSHDVTVRQPTDAVVPGLKNSD
jgi:hypothetical protein